MNQQTIKHVLLGVVLAIVFGIIGASVYVKLAKLSEIKQGRVLINEELFRTIVKNKGALKYPLAIDVDVSTNRLYLSMNQRIIKEYEVSVGKKSMPTPLGKFKITWKGFPVPQWTPDEPTILGTRWMEINLYKNGQKYGIHGTDEPCLIGSAVSHGCVRMRNADVEE